MISTFTDLTKYSDGVKADKKSAAKSKIMVSLGTCGRVAGGEPVYDAIKSAISSTGADSSVELIESGCMGLCHSEPTVEVVDLETEKSTIYGNVTAAQAEKIVNGLLDAGDVEKIARNWYYPELEDNSEGALGARIVLKNSGRINPENIDDYIAADGYIALGKVVSEMKSQEVIDVIKESGLRGRGGGGFPTGVKWSFAAAQDKADKFVICNADEGDPGAFMDRAVLEGDPHSVLEAMAIAGYAIGAKKGVIYIRAEYPLAISRLKIAIAQAEEKGLLGKNLFGSGFDFDLELKYGAGAFVCGEETALIHSIEGMRGEPTFKPPFPAVEGLWKKPTIVNNVETYGNIPAIIRKGASWFKAIGTEGSPGTKVFALAGKINKVGLTEVPMGSTLRDIIFGIGEGIVGGKEFKAVQTGGPSGGALKADKLDSEIDYESLKKLGSMMGSGGMIVMDEDDCMVDIAKFFLDFTLDESCGKCTPCRIGNKRLYEMLTKITNGEGTMQTIQDLKDLSASIKDTALCGLGQTSPNPVLSTLATFEDEYLAHIQDKKCPAGVCSNLLSFEVNDKCIGCTLCARNCPVHCIAGEKKGMHTIDQSECIKCGVCFDACKFHAIDKK